MEQLTKKSDLEDLFRGFSQLNRQERFARLQAKGLLTASDVLFLDNGGGLCDLSLAEKFIENVIGYFQVPLGVATNLKIDGKDYVIPMAVEETSIIAAVSKTARWVRENGQIATEILGQEIIGQIQIAKLNQDFDSFTTKIHANEFAWLEEVNREVACGLVKRGGGVTYLHVRKLLRPDGGVMAVIHVHANSCDAMGANIVNQVCEYLKGPIEAVTQEKVALCILSNLVDTKLTRAIVQMQGLSPELCERIAEASLFAELDPYRAATHNKGVLNGIDPILIATGNDWRAVEAGIHAFAAESGSYKAITKWRHLGPGTLQGEFLAPLVVGTVGGVTTLHPMAKLCLRMMGVRSANELSRVIAAVGLVQNLGALRALTTVGIIEGHMKLHIKNLSLGAGALESEMAPLQIRLEEILMLKKRISMAQAVQALQDLRVGTSLEA